MSEFQEWQLVFQQVYDGAYRYLDRCGEFMNILRSQFGFMPLSVNVNSCDMDDPQHALRVTANTDTLTITCQNPKQIESFFNVTNVASTKATEFFEPYLVHQNRLTSYSCLYTKNQEESLRLSVNNVSAVTQELSEVLKMSPYQQDFSITFSEGSRQLTFRLHPVVTNVTAGQRQLALPGSPKAVIEHLARREQLAQTLKGPSYALGFDITLIEFDPATPPSTEEMFERLQRQRLKILKTIKPLANTGA
jgi:hypothetical protein